MTHIYIYSAVNSSPENYVMWYKRKKCPPVTIYRYKSEV